MHRSFRDDTLILFTLSLRSRAMVLAVQTIESGSAKNSELGATKQ
jgi:hypothetical protein